MDKTSQEQRSASSPRATLKSVCSVVVKLGSQLLTGKDKKLDTDYLAQIAAQVATLMQNGVAVSIVSSGAVSAGLAELGQAKRPADLAKLQAVAAVGQRRLMDSWAVAFATHGLHVGQVLLTREDIDSRTRFLNLRNTIHAIHELKAIPVINENDTVSTDEIVKITFGDNDILAAMVAGALRAELLVLLSVVDGIYDTTGAPVRLVQSTEMARQLVRTEKSALGKGGMNSKVEAARMVTAAGESMVLADGRMANVLTRIVAGDEVGTLFTPAESRKRSSRSRWIDSVQASGVIHVDEGCAKALSQNKSLLAAGVAKVDGAFEPGDVVNIQSPDGKLIGRGLSNYASADVEKIRGKKSVEIRQMLAEGAYDEVVHRDNLVLVKG